MKRVIIRKLEPSGEEKWRYPAIVLEETEETVLVEATFDRPVWRIKDIYLNPGDRFVELYYRQRWYNIFQVHAGSSQAIKGWYCNVSYPPEMVDGEIRYVDLALDLLVYPDGTQQVLDEDEFEMLNLPKEVKEQALKALGELKRLVNPLHGFRIEKTG
jgi:protein associated with RNAse G/E